MHHRRAWTCWLRVIIGRWMRVLLLLHMVRHLVLLLLLHRVRHRVLLLLLRLRRGRVFVTTQQALHDVNDAANERRGQLHQGADEALLQQLLLLLLPAHRKQTPECRTRSRGNSNRRASSSLFQDLL